MVRDDTVRVPRAAGSQQKKSIWPHLHVGLEIVFASTAEGTQGTLVAFQACVDDHVSLPVALAFDDQSTHRTLEWFSTILRRALGWITVHYYLLYIFSIISVFNKVKTHWDCNRINTGDLAKRSATQKETRKKLIQFTFTVKNLNKLFESV